MCSPAHWKFIGWCRELLNIAVVDTLPWSSQSTWDEGGIKELLNVDVVDTLCWSSQSMRDEGEISILNLHEGDEIHMSDKTNNKI
jgi:hypothetical protein